MVLEKCKVKVKRRQLHNQQRLSQKITGKTISGKTFSLGSSSDDQDKISAIRRRCDQVRLTISSLFMAIFVSQLN